MHPAVTNGAYDVEPHPRGFPDPRHARSTASRWSISTTPPRRRSRRRCSTACSRPTPTQYANVHRGLHYLANEATEAYEGAREKVAAFLNAGRKEEIIFTRNATEAINLVAYTFGRERIKAGDEIVLSIMEHHSNIVPWHFLRERQGAVIKWAPVDDEGNFLLDEFEKLLDAAHQDGGDHPHVEHARHAGAGEGGDADRACARHSGADRRRAGAVHLDVDVQDIDCDFYAFTGHKLYGPTGIGVLYGKYAHLAAMPPFNGGGEMIREVFEDRIIYGEPPHKFEAGTPPIVQAIGLGAAIDYVDSVGKARIRSHEAGLLRYAHDRLREINSLRIFGTAKDKGPIVSFEMKGAHPHDVATVIDRSGVAVRAGTHCVMPLLARFGVTATCRASFAMYNTREEVDVPGAGADQGAGIFRMTDEPKTDIGEALRLRRRRPRAADAAERPSAIPADEMARLTDEIVAALKTVYDPEIPADIYELGLIYKVDIDDDRAGQDRHDADDAELSVGGRTAGPGGECGRRACPACARPRSTSSGIRRGIRAACRTRRARC